MELDIFIHGVPKGQSIWGKEDDPIYIQNFYTSREDETRFLVQLRDVKGKSFCYYSYLKYNNISAFDGRSGAYFGLSLRLDSYCSDTIGIYNILETIYKKYIVGSFLNGDKTKNKYLITDFKSKEVEIKKIEEYIISLIKLSLSPSDFMSLQDFTLASSSSIMEVNLIDCTKENVLNVIKKSSAIAISPFYPTIKDLNTKKQLEEQISSFKKTQEEVITRLQSENELKIKDCKEEALLYQQKNDELNTALQKSINETNLLTSENKRLKQIIEENKNSKDVERTVATLREPLTKLARLVGSENSSYEEFNMHRHTKKETLWDKTRKFILPILHTILLLVIVLLCSFRVSNYLDSKKNSNSFSQIHTMATKANKDSTQSVNCIQPNDSIKKDINGVQKNEKDSTIKKQIQDDKNK